MIAAAALAQESGPLAGLSMLRDVESKRASSWDRTGGNADYLTIAPKSTATLAEISGSGAIKHMWFTIASDSPFHLRELVLRMYWDGETQPSVEVPIGDFFGTGHEFEDIPGGHRGQRYTSWWSLPLTVQHKAMNCYFEMPFGRGARATITNDGAMPVPAFYYHIDYESYPSEAEVANKGRFHAQWRRELTKATPNAVNNLDGANNYEFMNAEGRGQYVGTILSIQGYSTGWWGEGDDMFFIDDDASPAISGTGSEDYFLGAWDFGGKPFSYQLYGAPVVGTELAGSRSSVYRFHLDAPITFRKSFKATIEHGHANHRSDNYYSVAYWYQTEPHAAFPPLPPVEQRLPALQAVGGPGNAGVAPGPAPK